MWILGKIISKSHLEFRLTISVADIADVVRGCSVRNILAIQTSRAVATTHITNV